MTLNNNINVLYKGNCIKLLVLDKIMILDGEVMSLDSSNGIG